MSPPSIPIERGEKFGKLTFVRDTGERRHGNRIGLFRCECGGRIETRIFHVTHGQARSCGCSKAGRVITHGKNKTPEHRAWLAAKSRCYYPKGRMWPRYGGRGVKMCAEWLHNFPAFLAHIGLKPSPEHTLDRWPNPDGDYAPGNVRWATPKQQRANQAEKK